MFAQARALSEEPECSPGDYRDRTMHCSRSGRVFVSLFYGVLVLMFTMDNWWIEASHKPRIIFINLSVDQESFLREA